MPFEFLWINTRKIKTPIEIAMGVFLGVADQITCMEARWYVKSVTEKVPELLAPITISIRFGATCPVPTAASASPNKCNTPLLVPLVAASNQAPNLLSSEASLLVINAAMLVGAALIMTAILAAAVDPVDVYPVPAINLLTSMWSVPNTKSVSVRLTAELPSKTVSAPAPPVTETLPVPMMMRSSPEVPLATPLPGVKLNEGLTKPE